MNVATSIVLIKITLEGDKSDYYKLFKNTTFLFFTLKLDLENFNITKQNHRKEANSSIKNSIFFE